MSIQKIDMGVRDSLRTFQILVGDQHLDGLNRETVEDALVAYACHLLDLNSKIETISDQKFCRLYYKFLRSFSRQNILYLDDMMTFFEGVRSALVHGTLLEIPQPLSWILHTSPVDARAVNSACVFLLKIGIARPDLETDMFNKYQAAESKAIEQLEVLDWQFVKEMHDVITSWFYNIPLDIKPKFGGGATADTKIKTKLDKYVQLRRVSALPLVDPEETYYPYYTFLSQRGWTDYTSRLIFVPKSWKALRTVKPEPPELMYWQQGVMECLYHYIAADPWLSRHFPFTNQAAHHDLIRFGSMSRTYSTLDLSQASDSVSKWLVYYLFSDTPLVDWLMRTRSTHYRYQGRTYPSNIFAGMGSALCFPIESIVFGSICQVVYLRAQATAPSRTGLYHDPAWSVYGDDIVVDTDLAPALVRALEGLHFTVNEDKSFIASDYLESCGKEYLNGRDITPLRYKLSRANGRCTLVSGLVTLANRSLLDYDSVRLYNWCRYRIEDILHHYTRQGRRFPFLGIHETLPSTVRDDTRVYQRVEFPFDELDYTSYAAYKESFLSLIHSSHLYDNYEVRWNDKLQVAEYRCTSVTMVPKSFRKIREDSSDPYVNSILLHEALRAPQEESIHIDKYSQMSGMRAKLVTTWQTIG